VKVLDIAQFEFVLNVLTPEGSEETDSPLNKKQKLPDEIIEIPPLPSFKNMKKSEIKKVKKERERLEKKAAKLQAKNEAMERKRMRGESLITPCLINTDNSQRTYRLGSTVWCNQR
jgi:hypothetical protein